jgi:hypothetical protein
MKRLIIFPIFFSLGSYSQINPTSSLLGHWQHVDCRKFEDGKEQEHKLFYKDLFIYENGFFCHKKKTRKCDTKWKRLDSVVYLKYPDQRAEQRLIIRRLTDSELVLIIGADSKVQIFDYYRRDNSTKPTVYR